MAHRAAVRGPGAVQERAGPRTGEQGRGPDPLVVVGASAGTVGVAVAGSVPGALAAANDALLRALYQDPHDVVLDLTQLSGGMDAGSLATLLRTDGLLEAWSGLSLRLVTDDARVRRLLRARYAGEVVHRVTAGPQPVHPAPRSPPARADLHLEARPKAVRHARDLVARSLLDWHAGRAIGSAVLVVGELVTNAILHAETDLEVEVAVAGQRVLLVVRDGSPERPRMLPVLSALSRGHGLQLVAGLSRAWGCLPGPAGGKAVWAVLDA